MTASSPSRRALARRSTGFTLVELAVVLIVVSLLTGGLLMSLSAQQEALARSDTQRRLNEARDALLGFAAANGRLPCPAAPGSNGVEAPSGGGTCTNYWNGYLPAITLGLAPTDANGYALDGWGNPIRYALATPSGAGNAYSTIDGMKGVWKNPDPTVQPDLQVCASTTGATKLGTANAACPADGTLANNAVAVVFSLGKNGAFPPVGADEKANVVRTDEKANIGDDRLFVSHAPTVAESAGGEFDDMVIWLSPYVLYNRLIAAGRLP